MQKTPQHILDEINSDINVERNLIKSIYIYFNRILINEKGAYSCAIEDLYLTYYLSSLIKKKWGINVLKRKTFELLEIFEKEWIEYRKKTPYGDDGFFVSYDLEWYKIIDKYLIETLKHMEVDLNEQGIQCSSYIANYSKDQKLNREELLERGRTLYLLLHSNNVLNTIFEST